MNERSTDLTSTRPYLLRAMHEWMSDNGETPLILVAATQPGVQVPEGFIEDDHIVLNVSWSATRNLNLGNELIAFEARFAGAPHSISVPLSAVKGIYARESGQGMMFQDEPLGSEATSDTAASAADNASHDDSPTGPEPDDSGGKKTGRPGLRIVK